MPRNDCFIERQQLYDLDLPRFYRKRMQEDKRLSNWRRNRLYEKKINNPAFKLQKNPRDRIRENGNETVFQTNLSSSHCDLGERSLLVGITESSVAFWIAPNFASLLWSQGSSFGCLWILLVFLRVVSVTTSCSLPGCPDCSPARSRTFSPEQHLLLSFPRALLFQLLHVETQHTTENMPTKHIPSVTFGNLICVGIDLRQAL